MIDFLVVRFVLLLFSLVFRIVFVFVFVVVLVSWFSVLILF